MPQNFDRDRITADELTEGDIVIHLNSHIQVISEPQYLARGITFEALWLDIDTPSNSQEVCFDPNWKFQLTAHIPVQNTEIAA